MDYRGKTKAQLIDELASLRVSLASVRAQATELAMQVSEERFRKLFDDGPLGMATVGSDFHFLTANAAFCRMLGYTEAELQALTFPEITAPECVASDIEQVQRLMRGEISDYQTEKRYLRNDQSIRWGAIIVSAIRDAGGAFAHFLVMVEDITEKKLAEAALRESEEKFRSIFENVQDIYYQTDMQGIITEISPSISRYSGYSREELIGQSSTKVYITPSDRERFHAVIQAQGEVTDYELRLHAKDQRPVIVSANAHLRYDAAHTPIGIEGTLRDVTERKLEQEALRLLLERFDLAARAARLGVWDWEIREDRLTCDDLLFELYGRKREEMAFTSYHDWLSVIYPDDIPTTASAMREALYGRKNLDIEFRVVLPGGAIRHLAAYAHVVHDAQGQPLRMTGINYDVTERKRQEEELLASRLELEKVNHRLTEANAMLEHLASTDALTDAWNRRHFEQSVKVEMGRAQRYNHPLSLLMFDIDHFKQVNDVYGHQSGDQILRVIANLVRANIRESDSLTRWGGEEFIVLTPELAIDDAARLGEKLRMLVAEYNFPEAGVVTVSFGVAEFHAGENLDTWIKHADDALYAAKLAGRNTLRCAGTQLSAV